MRNVGGERGHSRPGSLAAGVYCSTQRSRARTQYKPQSSSRVLRIRAARSWVNPSRASPRSALHVTSCHTLHSVTCLFALIKHENLDQQKLLHYLALFGVGFLSVVFQV